MEGVQETHVMSRNERALETKDGREMAGPSVAPVTCSSLLVG